MIMSMGVAAAYDSQMLTVARITSVSAYAEISARANGLVDLFLALAEISCNRVAGSSQVKG